MLQISNSQKRDKYITAYYNKKHQYRIIFKSHLNYKFHLLWEYIPIGSNKKKNRSFQSLQTSRRLHPSNESSKHPPNPAMTIRSTEQLWWIQDNSLRFHSNFWSRTKGPPEPQPISSGPLTNKGPITTNLGFLLRMGCKYQQTSYL